MALSTWLSNTLPKESPCDELEQARVYICNGISTKGFPK